MAMGTTVITRIIRTELNPVILIPITWFKATRLRVTTAIDNPKERAILSMIFIRLKKINVQVKPGRKKTSINPRNALIIGKRSRRGKANSNSPLIESSRTLLRFLNLIIWYYCP